MGVGSVIKRVSNSLRNCYRSASSHPLLMFMVFVLIWTYLWFPLLFTLLLHASPVIASTLLLLGTLLFYGHANAPEIQKEGTSHHHEIHNLVFRGMGNAEFDEETYLVHNMNISDGHKFGSSVDSRVSRKQEAKSELGNRKPVMVNRGAQFQPFGSGSHNSKSSDVSRRSSFDPSHSALGHLDYDNNGWDTGSDVVGSSSPSGSMVDHFRMLDEHLPHLESGEIHNETDDDDHYDHDDIEVKDDDEDETVITWTANDQRNLMNLGTLELERNQRLESLIARQKAIKNMRMLAEKNMANISPDIRLIDPHISTARNNPFDLSNHSHENIIRSVPSNMMARRHSVDVPYDLHEGKPDRMGHTFQSDYVASQTNNPMGRPHRSSDVGIMGHSTLDPYLLSVRFGFDTKPIGSTHTSDIKAPIIPRIRFSKNDDTVKLHQAAVGDKRSNEVKISGQNTGNEDKNSNKSSSSSFCDVTDDLNDGDGDVDEEEEFGSVENSPTKDSKALQGSEDSGDSDTSSDSDTDTEEAGLTQRLKSWFTGWKA